MSKVSNYAALSSTVFAWGWFLWCPCPW